MKQKYVIWLPVLYCVLLSFATMFVGNGTVLYFQLPICFLFVASAQLSLLERIEAVERALRESTASEVEQGTRAP